MLHIMRQIRIEEASHFSLKLSWYFKVLFNFVQCHLLNGNKYDVVKDYVYQNNICRIILFDNLVNQITTADFIPYCFQYYQIYNDRLGSKMNARIKCKSSMFFSLTYIMHLCKLFQMHSFKCLEKKYYET